ERRRPGGHTAALAHGRSPGSLVVPCKPDHNPVQVAVAASPRQSPHTPPLVAPMLLIPAIDIKDGKCVRLRQGDMSRDTVYADDPVAVARRWADAGARRLHIVDLNGATDGRPINFDIVHAIADACPEVPIQVGGGIRDED